MDQQEPNIKAELVECQEPACPLSIRLTQIWLVVTGGLPLLGMVVALLRGFYLQFYGKENALPSQFTAESADALLWLLFNCGGGFFALLTAWGLQKRARASRWLALVIIGLVTVRTGYYLVTTWNAAASLSVGIALTDRGLMIATGLLQLTMLFRFAFGKREKEFLSK